MALYLAQTEKDAGAASSDAVRQTYRPNIIYLGIIRVATFPGSITGLQGLSVLPNSRPPRQFTEIAHDLALRRVKDLGIWSAEAINRH